MQAVFYLAGWLNSSSAGTDAKLGSCFLPPGFVRSREPFWQVPSGSGAGHPRWGRKWPKWILESQLMASQAVPSRSADWTKSSSRGVLRPGRTLAGVAHATARASLLLLGHQEPNWVSWGN